MRTNVDEAVREVVAAFRLTRRLGLPAPIAVASLTLELAALDDEETGE